ncbi:TPA: hypothetical protein GRI54_23865 [Vibrio parahaemolyticus]|uniref:hypothetical protein n=1 Tax=Vibrio harveyi group TaxID=717610 RepID=UPI0003FE6D09|nr:hypothetical protein [Vibrio parahaemolyticus]ELB2807992.1 hypothetical protein [Vibrio alginolyticus]EGR1752560.1 hypothetical protein [Vibrio parahaemolyticus]EIV1709817.1 hypothetical protein [Vibrio parahaemolyticus]EJE4706373.1 hypothetical protein [Vibrio parahaemolyticus]ELB2846036.1 hypothetical protein [Vibrio alginolyticus]
MKKYTKEACLIFVGFYLFAVLFVAVESNSKDLVVVLNSLGGFISAGGALAAILTIIQVARNREIDSKYNSSSAQIRQIEYYLNDVLDCLIDDEGKPKNNRVEWIQAARAILDSQEMAKEVQSVASDFKLPELEIALNAQMNRVRLHLYKSLCVKEGNRAGSLPASFFFGVENWENKTFEEAEKESNSKNHVCYSHNGTGVAPIWGNTELDERSVFVVARFMLGEGQSALLETVSESRYDEIPQFSPYEGMAVYLKKRT